MSDVEVVVETELEKLIKGSSGSLQEGNSKRFQINPKRTNEQQERIQIMVNLAINCGDDSENFEGRLTELFPVYSDMEEVSTILTKQIE